MKDHPPGGATADDSMQWNQALIDAFRAIGRIDTPPEPTAGTVKGWRYGLRYAKRYGLAKTANMMKATSNIMTFTPDTAWAVAKAITGEMLGNDALALFWADRWDLPEPAAKRLLASRAVGDVMHGFADAVAAVSRLAARVCADIRDQQLILAAIQAEAADGADDPPDDRMRMQIDPLTGVSKLSPVEPVTAE